jgi:hypothetical protein
MSPVTRLVCLSLLAVVFTTTAFAQSSTSASTSSSTLPGTPVDEYLSWTADHAVNIGKSWRVNGRVGGVFDLRIIHTEHSYNYKLRATLMTPEVIRATARLEQLRLRLSDDEARKLVSEADNENQIVVLVEIDAREGSGVIPLEWRSALRPKGVKGNSPDEVAGTNSPSLRQIKGLSGVARRDYAYDIFWLVFPIKDRQGNHIWRVAPNSIELVVGIYNKEGRVTWPISEQLRQRLLPSQIQQK